MGSRKASVSVIDKCLVIEIIDSNGEVIATNERILLDYNDAVSIAMRALSHIKDVLGYDHCYERGEPASIRLIRMMVQMDIDERAESADERDINS